MKLLSYKFDIFIMLVRSTLHIKPIKVLKDEPVGNWNNDIDEFIENTIYNDRYIYYYLLKIKRFITTT
jgi:hypothetical protein